MNLKFKMKCLLLIISSVVVLSCDSSEDYKDINYNLLGYVLGDNPNLSSFNTAVKRSGISEQLLGEGDLAVFAPSNLAFERVSAYFPNALTGPIEPVSNMTKYHIAENVIDVNMKELGKYKEVSTLSGEKIYYARWYDNYRKDTVMMVNGCLVNKRRANATNGVLYVLDRVLSLPTHHSLLDFINHRDDLTLFAQAIIYADMKAVFSGSELYTVFAPNNNAMYAAGYSSLESIREADPLVLRKLILEHILKDRFFVKDFYMLGDMHYEGNVAVDTWLASGAAERVGKDGIQGSLSLGMLSGGSIQFRYSYSELLEYGYLDGERLELIDAGGNISKVHLANRDFALDNGALHVVDSVLP